MKIGVFFQTWSSHWASSNLDLGEISTEVDRVYLAALPLRSKVNSKSLVLLFEVTLALSRILNQAHGPNSEAVKYLP